MPRNPTKLEAPEPKPGVIVGDELYVQHQGQACSGRVSAHGRHGVTVKIGGKHHKVKWGQVHGHKRRIAQHLEIADQGEDGMLVKGKDGRRHYVATPNDAKEDPMVAKAQRAVVLFTKADPPSTPRAGLTKKQLTDKAGRQTTRWVRVDRGGPPAQRGQHVGFENGEHRGHGQVVASGQHGVTVRDGAGGEHRVLHEKVTHHWGGDGAPDQSPHEADDRKPRVQPHQGDPGAFKAADFARQHDDPSATSDSIIAHFGGDARAKIDAARQRLGTVRQTVDEHAQGGKWNEERAALHRKIIFDGVEINGKKVPGLLAPERIKAAIPPAGQRPTFIALGGRGGSGKSSLNGRVYDEGSAVVLDADHIKGMLPEYQGWNAHQVHEESSHVLETVMEMAKILGVNVVLDATMKSGASVSAKVDDFKKAGFRIEAHYMHLPRQEAAKRAMGRFLRGGEKGRFVPPEVVLGNTQNEVNFDAVKDKADAWSFHDNSGEKGAVPTLIASKGEPATVRRKPVDQEGQPMVKSDQRAIIFLRGSLQS